MSAPGNLHIVPEWPADHRLINFVWEDMGQGSSQRLFSFVEGVNFETLVNSIIASCQAGVMRTSPAPGPHQEESLGLPSPAAPASEAPVSMASEAGFGGLPDIQEDADVVVAPPGPLCIQRELTNFRGLPDLLRMPRLPLMSIKNPTCFACSIVCPQSIQLKACHQSR